MCAARAVRHDLKGNAGAHGREAGSRRRQRGDTGASAAYRHDPSAWHFFGGFACTTPACGRDMHCNLCVVPEHKLKWCAGTECEGTSSIYLTHTARRQARRTPTSLTPHACAHRWCARTARLHLRRVRALRQHVLLRHAHAAPADGALVDQGGALPGRRGRPDTQDSPAVRGLVPLSLK